MREIALTAERLRMVRQAHQHFLALAAVDCLLAWPLDWMARDLTTSDHLPSIDSCDNDPAVDPGGILEK